MSDVAAIFGGPSPEHDVSVLTGLQAVRGLVAGGVGPVRALYWSKTGDWYEVDASLEASAFVDGVPRGATAVKLTTGQGGGFQAEGGRLGRTRALDLDAAILCTHGGPGEDGTLQAALDLGGIRYAGPSVAGAALAMDKLAFSGLMASAGLPCLPRVQLEPDLQDLDFPSPYIVKPRFGGSSIGIDVVEDLTTARARLTANPHLRTGAVIEPYRPDLYDLQIAVRSWPRTDLSAIERPLRAAEAGPGRARSDILGYSEKYVGGEGMASAPRELPAVLDPSVTARLRGVATQVAHLVAVRGVARIDFLSDGRDLFVNEVNSIPGSLARYLWIEPPLAFSQLLVDLLGEARAAPSHVYSAAGADGTVLRGAASIAAKLA